MKATIWHNPKCGTSRKTLAILEETPGVDVEVIEYLKTPYSRDKIAQLIADAGMTPADAIDGHLPPSHSPPQNSSSFPPLPR